MKRIRRVHIILMAIIFVAVIVRFYNLDWGDGNFFHPDERNIGNAIASINLTTGDLNPNFFAYGSLPIYMVYLFSQGDFELSLIYGRFISAFFSVISLFLIFEISKSLLTPIISESRKLLNTKKVETYALIATAICAFSPGLIQFAHFTTFETFLLFEYLLFTYLAIRLVSKPSWSLYTLLAIVLGLSVATKVVSLFLLGVFLGVHFLIVLKYHQPKPSSKLKNFMKYILEFFNVKLFSSLIIGVCVFLITNPYMILDFESFRGSMIYESSVATGELLVFYTQQFLDTIPFIYQFQYVFPSQISWPITILGFISVMLLSIFAIQQAVIFIFRNRKSPYLPLFIFLAVGFGYGIFHFYLFVKWTRYMLPLLPFLIISMTIVFAKISINKNRVFRIFGKITFAFAVIFGAIQGLNFFTIYLQPDPRVVASTWLAEKSSTDATFVGETYDIGMTSFNSALGSHRITELNLYDVDDGINDEAEIANINQVLNDSEFVIIPAERVYPTRSRLPDNFPNGYRYYDDLFLEENGFRIIAQFDRETYLERVTGIPFYSSKKFMPLNYDETFKVFDQPTITILEKI